MSKMFQSLVKIVILICIVGGLIVVYQSREEKKQQQEDYRNTKAITLKKFLLGFKKPSRIEVFNYTKRFENDVAEIKKMTMPLDENSDIYLTIQFFTDENDNTAPLVAQVRFMDSKTDNIVKEESINLQ